MSGSARACLAASVAGAAAMAGASWSAGALPVHWHPVARPLAIAVFYCGLTALVLAWLFVGRRLLGAELAPAWVARFTLTTAAPLLLAAPFGRDLWAYAAQGHLTGTGADPYATGPAAAPSPFSDEVSPRWLHSPAPYGPVWLRLSQAGAWLAHGHPTAAVLLLRLPAFVGLALCCWAVSRLAARLGGYASIALWLGAADPLMTVLGVGGGHNDLLMLGLALAGLAIACEGTRLTLAVGVAIGCLAALVKSPALIVVAFTVPAWMVAGRRPGLRNVVVGCAIAAGTAVAAVAGATALTGLGFGWTRQVNSGAQWVSWLSLPSALAMAARAIAGASHPQALDATQRAFRTVGEVAALVLLVVLWIVAVQRAHRGSPPTALLALALAGAALLGPSVQPWYYLWGLAVAGLVTTRRVVLWVLAAIPVMFVFMITPTGWGLESGWPALPIAAGAFGLVALFRREVVQPPASAL